MRGSPSTPPADPEPYTECLHCTPYGKGLGSLAELRAPRLSAALDVDPDGIDWGDYYWGYNGYNRSKRRAIIRPLPQSITDRIPLELVGHILDFLRRETWDLYNCALVCHAWHHHSQPFLYSCVVIRDHAAYDAVAHSLLRKGTSRQHLAATRSLLFAADRSSPSRMNSLVAAHLTLGRALCSLRCLKYIGPIRPPYHPSFPLRFSCFSATLCHLTLHDFRLNSFSDLRRIICGLKKLCELDLLDGELVSKAGATNPSSGFPPVDAPHLSKVAFSNLGHILFSALAQWIISTDVCRGCASLFLWFPTDGRHWGRPWEGPCAELLAKLGPSLNSLDHNLFYPGSGQRLDALACCTGLSTVKLEVGLDEQYSWQGLVTALYETLSHLSSPVISTLQVVIEMQESSAWAQPESEFSAIDLQSIHDLIKVPLFDSLQRAGIDVWHREPRLTSDAVLTGDEMERRIRLILEPWDRRGILTVERLRDELTYEKMRELELEPGRTRTQEARGLKELWSEASPEETSRSSWDGSKVSGDESGDSEDESGNSGDESENLGDGSEDLGDESEDSGEESEDTGDESEDSGGESEDSGGEGEDSGEGSEDSEDEIEDSADGSEA